MKEEGQFRGEQPNKFHIETVTGPGGGEVSHSVMRGGLITSLKLGGTEVLYFDEETFRDPDANVKGGIPILFPNAGPLTGEAYPGLQQHGFARTSVDWVATEGQPDHGFLEVLEVDAASRKAYPHDFRLSVSGQLMDDGSFTLLQRVENLDPHEALPVAMGLHPYFKVPNAEKGNIGFDFEGGAEIESRIEEWANGEAVSIENPKVKDPAAEMRIHIPELGTLVIDASPEYKRIWIWSMPDKDFVCIEPVMRDAGGLEEDPELVEPGGEVTGQVKIRLEQ